MLHCIEMICYSADDACLLETQKLNFEVQSSVGGDHAAGTPCPIGVTEKMQNIST